MPNDPENEQMESPEDSSQFSQAGDTQPIPTTDQGEVDDPEIDVLSVEIKLTEAQEMEIVSFLEDNLPKMSASEDEQEKYRTYFAMYEMSPRARNFPYENAPSLASSDAHDKLNDWLDDAETAFLQPKVTFAIDREDSPFTEEEARRVERTVHKKFFLGTDFSRDIRKILFESGYLGASILEVVEQYDIVSSRETVIIKDEEDLAEESGKISVQEINKAKDKLAIGQPYVTQRDVLKTVNIGPAINRIDLTKFLFPRNAVNSKEWQVTARPEFYTRSALEKMAEMGQIKKDALEKALAARRDLYRKKMDEENSKQGTLEPVKPELLDSDWSHDISIIKQMGDSYDDEFAIYRTTMLYRVPTKLDPSGKIPAWIQVLYCPAGKNILGATFCQDGSPYFKVEYRPLPYRALGMGIAQQRFNSNLMVTDLLSMGLASIEQEMGAPLLIRDKSGLFATGFRAYPGSATITSDVKNDAAFMPFPEKSRLAVEGIKTVLGSSPDSNKGVGYGSGKKEELLYKERQIKTRARLFSIAMDLDRVFNAAWKILCRLAKLNTPSKKYVDWVIEDNEEAALKDENRLYVKQSEMDPSITWSSVVSATSLTPEDRMQRAMQMMELFHDKQPVAVNSPRLTIGWLDFMADFFPEMTPAQREKLLPNQQDFQQLQQSQAAAGGERPNAGQPPGPQANQPVSPMAAQSKATPFRNPAALHGGNNGNSHGPKPTS